MKQIKNITCLSWQSPQPTENKNDLVESVRLAQGFCSKYDPNQEETWAIMSLLKMLMSCPNPDVINNEF